MIYTIIQERNKFTVKYFENYHIKTLAGQFDDPGEASQEFKKQFPGEHEHLTPLKFSHIQEAHRKDLERLRAWNNG